VQRVCPIVVTRIEDIAHFVKSYDAGAVFPELTLEAVANSILVWERLQLITSDPLIRRARKSPFSLDETS
jgi:hypothetical protein